MAKSKVHLPCQHFVSDKKKSKEQRQLLKKFQFEQMAADKDSTSYA